MPSASSIRRSASQTFFGQQRSVQVGADHVPAPHALVAVAAVVAVAREHAPERALPGAEIGAPAVVLEAGDHARRRRPGRPRSRSCRSAAGPARGRCGGPRARSRAASPLAQLVGVAEQLVAAADGEHHGATLGRRVKRVALRLGHVPGHGHLVAILAAAEVEEVVRGRVDRVAQRRRGELEARSRATRSAPAARRCCRGPRRCSSARGRARRPADGAQATTITTVLPTWSAVSGTWWRAGRLEAGRARLVLEAIRADDVEHERCQLLGRASPVGRHGLARRSTITCPATPRARPDGLAREHPAVALGHVGVAGRAVLRRRRPRTGRRAPRAKRAAGDEVLAVRVEQGDPLGRAAEQLHDLHRGEHEREAASSSSKRASHRRPGVQRQPALARASASSAARSVGVRVERVHVVAAACEVQRHPPGAGTRGRAPGRPRLGGELAPERRGRPRRTRILDVVPDHGAGVSCRPPAASPRRDSRSRSSSSAV